MMAGISAMMIMATTTALAQTADRTFESEEDGFRLQVPQGWVIQDDNITPRQLGNEVIAALCLENEALPAVGGAYNCEAAARTDEISIERWSDLQSRPEFENITTSNYTITTNDLLALRIQWLNNNASVFGIKIENSTDDVEIERLRAFDLDNA